LLGEHAIEIGIPAGDGVPHGEFLGEQRLKVADRYHTRAVELSNFVGVTISDLSTANDANVEHPILSRFHAGPSGREIPPPEVD
jgi:hypothetical protein